MHGTYAGPPRGNRNALTHGLRSAEALALRRQVSELLRESRALVEKQGKRMRSAGSARGAS
jgi:hypothetical protein